jgi:hypothetical protein
MPTQVRLLQLDDLSHKESPNQIFLDTLPNTELSIYTTADNKTVIAFPYGNKFDIIDNKIIIHEKN